MKTIGYVKEFTVKKKVMKTIRVFARRPYHRELVVYDSCYVARSNAKGCRENLGGSIADAAHLKNTDVNIHLSERVANGYIYEGEVEEEVEETYRCHMFEDYKFIAKSKDGSPVFFKKKPCVSESDFSVEADWFGFRYLAVDLVEEAFEGLEWHETLTELIDVTEREDDENYSTRGCGCCSCD